MSMRVSIEPSRFVGECIAAYITQSSLATKITTVVRAVFMGAITFALKYPYAIPFGTVLPISIGVSLFVLFAETIFLGYAYLE
jgi:hypothetical protein